jgi:Flp pilus assembly protein TadD
MALIVLLFMLPRTPGNEVSSNTETVTAPAQSSGLEAELDSVLQIINSGAPMEGILALRDLADKYPEAPEPQFYLGIFSIQTGQYEKAVERFRRVVELQPGNWEAWKLLGDVSLELGDDATAIEAWEAYLDLNPEAEDRSEVEQILNELKN